VKVISEQLGHASISFTLERYSHVLPSIQEEAAARVVTLLSAYAVFNTRPGQRFAQPRVGTSILPRPTNPFL
jgi:hypothetical protein